MLRVNYVAFYTKISVCFILKSWTLILNLLLPILCEQLLLLKFLFNTHVNRDLIFKLIFLKIIPRAHSNWVIVTDLV